MITYVDTSTLLKLVIEEDGSDEAAVIWDAADTVTSVSLVVVEGRAALAGARRGRRLTEPQHQRARDGLATLIDELHLIEIRRDLVLDAAQLAGSEGLRGCDAVHLAGALLVDASILASADGVLCDAAARRGLHVANPLA